MKRLTYEEVRKTLGGPLESVWVPELDAHNIIMYCDEEGKLKMKKPSVALFGSDGEVYDIVAGTVLSEGYDQHTGDDIPLTEEQVNVINNLFDYCPELDCYFYYRKRKTWKRSQKDIRSEMGGYFLYIVILNKRVDIEKQNIFKNIHKT